MAFVKEKLVGRESSEGGLEMDSLLQCTERLAAAPAFGAGESDVRMKGAGLRGESEKGCD